jgi:F0F1-type ATP synthase membrane subunit c/vacuolar-type H+-ATPase subunit K
MRQSIVITAALAVGLSACASAPGQVSAPRGLGSKKEAADRAQCQRQAQSVRNSPSAIKEVEQSMTAQHVGVGIGFGLIGIAVSVATADSARQSYMKNIVDRVANECLQKKGYK